MALRVYLTLVNKRRDREEGAVAEAAATQDDMPVEKRIPSAVDYEDVTDWNTRGFRYRM